jgi:hypothetical protein
MSDSGAQAPPVLCWFCVAASDENPQACAMTSAKERFAISKPVPASLARSCPRSFLPLALLASVRMTDESRDARFGQDDK